MDKKKIIITITVVALIILIGVLVFMKVKNSNIENNDGLSVIEQITLNDSEKEILAMLKELDHSLQNPNERKITYESNEDDNSMNFMPTESMGLNDFISEIYEARKSITEDGNIIYLLDVNLKTTENMASRRMISVSNGIILAMTFDESDFSSNSTEANAGELSINFSSLVAQAITNAIKKLWDEALVFENVNYNNILKGI